MAVDSPNKSHGSLVKEKWERTIHAHPELSNASHAKNYEEFDKIIKNTLHTDVDTWSLWKELNPSGTQKASPSHENHDASHHETAHPSTHSHQPSFLQQMERGLVPGVMELVRKPKFMDEDPEFWKLLDHEQKKWHEENKKPGWGASKEEKLTYEEKYNDFYYGKLDADTTTEEGKSLEQRTKENLQKKYESETKENGEKKSQKQLKKDKEKLARFNENANKITRKTLFGSVKPIKFDEDHEIGHVKSAIQNEASSRYELLKKRGLKGSELDQSYQAVIKRIQEKRWKEFAEKHPEKATHFAKEQYKTKDKHAQESFDQFRRAHEEVLKQKEQAPIIDRGKMHRNPNEPTADQVTARLQQAAEKKDEKTPLTPEQTTQRLASLQQSQNTVSPSTPKPLTPDTVADRLAAMQSAQKPSASGLVHPTGQVAIKTPPPSTQTAISASPPTPTRPAPLSTPQQHIAPAPISAQGQFRPGTGAFRRFIRPSIPSQGISRPGGNPWQHTKVNNITNVLGNPVSAAKNFVKDQAMKMVTQAAKKAIMQFATKAIVPLLPYIGIALLVILLIIIIVAIIMTVLGGSSNNSSSSTIPGLTITLTGPTQVENSANIEYTIDATYTENGDVTLFDPLPMGTSFVSATGAYTEEGNAISWRLNDNQTTSASSSATTAKSYRFQIILRPGLPDTIVKNKILASAEGISGSFNPGGPPIEGGSSNACTQKYEGSGYCSVANLKQYFGGDEKKAIIASMICQTESRSNPNALNTNCGTNDYSVGLFQINLVAHCAGAYAGLSCRNLVDINKRNVCEGKYRSPEENIKYMVQLSQNGTKWTDWSAYTSASIGAGRRAAECGIN